MPIYHTNCNINLLIRILKSNIHKYTSQVIISLDTNILNLERSIALNSHIEFGLILIIKSTVHRVSFQVKFRG